MAVKHFEGDEEFHLRINNVKYEEKFIWTDHNIKAAVCLRVLLILQHVSPIITILCDMGKIQLMGHQVDLKENLLDLRNQEERPSELFAFAAEKLDTKEPEHGKCLQGLGILKPSREVP